MKRIVIALSICMLSLPVFSQTCEERESRIVQGFAGFSSGLLYNTYGLIGSISDGYTNEIYNFKTIDGLLSAQIKLADNLVAVLNAMISDKSLKNQADLEYVTSVSSILQGLKKQAELMLAYARSKTPERLEAYGLQRNKNWSDISKLMGVAE